MMKKFSDNKFLHIVVGVVSCSSDVGVGAGPQVGVILCVSPAMDANVILVLVQSVSSLGCVCSKRTVVRDYSLLFVALVVKSFLDNLMVNFAHIR